MPLTANFLADFSSFTSACLDATKSTDELVEAAGKVGATLDQALDQASSSMKSVGQGIADFGQKAWSVLSSSQLQQFAGDVTTFVSGYVAEFAEAEAATARLNTALQNAGHEAPEIAQAYADMATNLQKVSTFSDEAITNTMTLFTSVGKVGPANMQAALEATMNLASGLAGEGMTLETAAKLVSKALASDGDSLGKLGVILGDTVPKGASFAQIMDAINSKFGGASQAALETTAGSMENLKNQMSDINETIGKVFADNLRVLFEWFQSLPEGIQTFIIAAVALGTALAPLLVSLASLVSFLGASGLGGALGTAATAVATFVVGLVSWPAVIIAAIVALAAAIYFYWDEIVAFLGGVVEKITYFMTEMLPEAFNSIVGTLKTWYEAVKYWLQDQFIALIEKVILLPPKIGEAFKSMYNTVKEFLSGLGVSLEEAGVAVGIFVTALLGWPGLIIGAMVALAVAIYKNWDEIVAFFQTAVEKIKYFLTQSLPDAFNSAIEFVKKFYNELKHWLQDQLTKVIDFVVAAAARIGAAFQWLYSVVVGFSSVPDMIDGIAYEFGRLDRVMVDPALAAVDEVAAAFSKGIEPMNLSAVANGAFGAGAGAGGGAGVNVTVNMTGMLGTDDPQTRALVNDLVSSAVMQGMRGGRLLGTA